MATETQWCSGVDNLVQKTEHQQQSPGNRRWDVIEVPGFLCVVLAYGSRHVGIRGYLGSVTAPPTKETFLTPFPGARPLSRLPPPCSTYHIPSFTTDSFPGCLNHWALLIGRNHISQEVQNAMKREEPAIQVDCVVREKKITLEPKDRLELYHSMFCCFEDQQLWHCLGPCFKGCVLGSTQTSWIRVCMFTITLSDS